MVDYKLAAQYADHIKIIHDPANEEVGEPWGAGFELSDRDDIPQLLDLCCLNVKACQQLKEFENYVPCAYLILNQLILKYVTLEDHYSIIFGGLDENDDSQDVWETYSITRACVINVFMWLFEKGIRIHDISYTTISI